MKAGTMVRFDCDGLNAYGKVVWVEGDIANVDFKNPVTLEYEVGKLEISKLIIIGNYV